MTSSLTWDAVRKQVVIVAMLLALAFSGMVVALTSHSTAGGVAHPVACNRVLCTGHSNG